MSTDTEQLLADLFAAKAGDKERDLAIALATHLNKSSKPWSFVLREPNSTSLLTPQEFAKSKTALVLISVNNTCYAWSPKNRLNVDMLMLE